jgi:16S rRNA processing protein RimM
MLIDDCFELGYIVKTHGLKGQVYVQLDVDDPSEYYKMESVLAEKSGKLIPFFVSGLKPQGDKLLVTFEDIDHIDQASQIVGLKLFLPLDQLPAAPDDGYYYHELIGMKVSHASQPIGVVKDIYQPSSQYLLAVDFQDNEVLIPIEDHIVLSVDKQKGEIVVDLPEGLLEIFTS